MPSLCKIFLWCPTKGFIAIRIKVCLSSYPEPKQCQPPRPAQEFGVEKQGHYRISSSLCPESITVITHALLTEHLQARPAERPGLKLTLTGVQGQERLKEMDWLLVRNICLLMLLMVSENQGLEERSSSCPLCSPPAFYMDFLIFNLLSAKTGQGAQSL